MPDFSTLPSAVISTPSSGQLATEAHSTHRLAPPEALLPPSNKHKEESSGFYPEQTLGIHSCAKRKSEDQSPQLRIVKASKVGHLQHSAVSIVKVIEFNGHQFLGVKVAGVGNQNPQIRWIKFPRVEKTLENIEVDSEFEDSDEEEEEEETEEEEEEEEEEVEEEEEEEESYGADIQQLKQQLLEVSIDRDKFKIEWQHLQQRIPKLEEEKANWKLSALPIT